MSTSEPAIAGDDSFVEDRTQPTAEILNALSALNSPIKTEPQQPPREYILLNAQLTENPHSPEAWRRLVDISEESGDIEKISATYDALLKQYPNTVCATIDDMFEFLFFPQRNPQAQAQIQYISHFTTNENHEKVDALFTKFLKSSPCVELWSFY